MPIKYPEMRLNLTAACRDLSDETFHIQVWANPRMPTPDKRFPFDEAVAFVVDDLNVPSQQTLVGDVLADETEMDVFDELSRALIAMLSRIGPRGTYTEASTTPEWEEVRSAARKLIELLTQ